MSRLARLAVICLMALQLAACADRFYFFMPTKITYASPHEKGLNYEEVSFASADGTMLSGWFLFAQGKRRGTVAYFQGTARNISSHLRYVDWLPSHGYDVFLFDYRGYGKSDGFPTPKGVHDDCIAALTYLRQRADVDSNRLIVFGQSLGGNYVLDALASTPRTGIQAVIIEGAFASHREIADDKVAPYPMPTSWRRALIELLIDDTYDSLASIDKVDDVPLLLIHGTADQVVPYRHAQLLLAASHRNANLWTVPGGRHLDTFASHGDGWRQRFVHYLEDAQESKHSKLTDITHKH
ncbi:alpha/beta hydrolase [Herbaspirillum sp. HC18]|nr:alpha/beta hydrolase [Herbaspirillum sp. HC18]